MSKRWSLKDDQFLAEMAMKIDRATEGQVSRAAIRPDIFGSSESAA